MKKLRGGARRQKKKIFWMHMRAWNVDQLWKWPQYDVASTSQRRKSERLCVADAHSKTDASCRQCRLKHWSLNCRPCPSNQNLPVLLIIKSSTKNSSDTSHFTTYFWLTRQCIYYYIRPFKSINSESESNWIMGPGVCLNYFTKQKQTYLSGELGKWATRFERPSIITSPPIFYQRCW